MQLWHLRGSFHLFERKYKETESASVLRLTPLPVHPHNASQCPCQLFYSTFQTLGKKWACWWFVLLVQNLKLSRKFHWIQNTHKLLLHILLSYRMLYSWLLLYNVTWMFSFCSHESLFKKKHTKKQNTKLYLGF